MSLEKRQVLAIMAEARRLPPDEQLTVNRATTGTVDLTGAKAFLTNDAMRTRFTHAFLKERSMALSMS